MRKLFSFSALFTFFVLGVIYACNTNAQAVLTEEKNKNGEKITITEEKEDQVWKKKQHLTEIGVISPSFTLSQMVSRQAGLAVAMKAAGVFPSASEVTHFNDINDPWVRDFTTEGVRQGVLVPGDRFEGDTPITRAQFLQWSARFARIPTRKYLKQGFISEDIPSSSPYAETFAYAKTYGVIILPPNARFSPNESLKGADVIHLTYDLLQVRHAGLAERQKRKDEALMSHFINALEGQRMDLAEANAQKMQKSAKQKLLRRSGPPTIGVDALSKAVQHFLASIKALKQEKTPAAMRELFLSLKQCRRVPAHDSLADDAQQLEAVILQTLTKIQSTP